MNTRSTLSQTSHGTVYLCGQGGAKSQTEHTITSVLAKNSLFESEINHRTTQKAYIPTGGMLLY